MMTLKFSSIDGIADLKGKRAVVGPAGGGTIVMLKQVFGLHGMSMDDITPSFLSYGDGFSQLADGNVDAAFAVSRVQLTTLRTRCAKTIWRQPHNSARNRRSRHTTGCPSSCEYSTDLRNTAFVSAILDDGDTVVCEVDGIGQLENRMLTPAPGPQ